MTDHDGFEFELPVPASLEGAADRIWVDPETLGDLDLTRAIDPDSAAEADAITAQALLGEETAVSGGRRV